MAKSGRNNIRREGMRVKLASMSQASATFAEFVAIHNAKQDHNRKDAAR